MPAELHDSLYDEQCAFGLAALERSEVAQAALFARQTRLLSELTQRTERRHGADGVERFLVLEVAATLRIGQIAATSRLVDADRLVQTLTRTLTGLTEGWVLLGQAKIVLEQTRNCTDAVAAEVERRVLADRTQLAGWTAKRLRERVAAEVLAVEAELAPAQAEERERSARASRRVTVSAQPDAMGSLWALLPAEQLAVFSAGLDELTRRQAAADRAAGVDRTTDQRRADVLALLPALALHALDHPALTHPALASAAVTSSSPGALDPAASLGTPAHGGVPGPAGAPGAEGAAGPTGAPGPAATTEIVGAAGRADAAGAAPGTGRAPGCGPGCALGRTSVVLNVHVPMATVLGLSSEPGYLAGYGPIPASRTRLLAVSSSLRRVLVDETTRRPIAVDDRTTPPAGTADRARAHLLAMLPDGRSRPPCSPAEHGRASHLAGDEEHREPAVPAPHDPGDENTDGAHVSRRRVLDDVGHDELDHAVLVGLAAEPGDGRDLDDLDDLEHAGASDGELDGTGELERAEVVCRSLGAPTYVAVTDTAEPQHDPSGALTRLVQPRDRLCTGPGCSAASTRSDLDHLQSWPAGVTAAWNLRPKSRRCHRAKTFSWQVHDADDGTTTWTSPNRRTYRVPSPWRPPPPVRADARLAPPVEIAPDQAPRWPRLGFEDGLTAMLAETAEAASASAPPALALTVSDDEPPF